MFYVSLFVFGLFVGSFINVVSLRYRPDRKLLSQDAIGGRSRCPRCFRKLGWRELVPIFSFLFQKGSCRHCGGKISFQYPLVEILSGLIFVFIPFILTYDLRPTTYDLWQLLVVGCWLFVFMLFLLLSIIDLRHYLIPDQINLSLAVLGIVLIVINSFLFADSDAFAVFERGSFLGRYGLLFNFNFLENLSIFQSFNLSIFLNHIFSAILAMFMFGAIIIFTRGQAMGWGDFKLVGALGLIFGWPDIIMIIALSFIIGAVVVFPFLISGKKTMKDVVPFGPFLIIASALVFFFGFQIIDAYFKLFGIIMI